MPESKHIRFIDVIDVKAIGGSDFIIRRRTKTQAIYSLLIALIVIIGGVSIIVYNDTIIASFLCGIIGLVMGLIGRQFEKMRNMLLVSEYMNTMLTSVLGLHHQFCLITKLNGEMVYLSKGFYKAFPDFLDQPKRNVETWLDIYRVPPESRDKILKNVQENQEEKMVISISEGNPPRVTQDILLYIEPIPRPKGYVLLRGKEIT